MGFSHLWVARLVQVFSVLKAFDLGDRGVRSFAGPDGHC